MDSERTGTTSNSKQWVLIRGMLSEAFHWLDFLPLLKNRYPNDTIHTADIVGNGETGHLLTPSAVRANLSALRVQVPARGKKIVVGFSLGGMLALEWAYAYPDEVEAVVVINASVNSSPFYRRMTPYAVTQIVRSALTRDPHQREDTALRMTTQLKDIRRSEVAVAWAKRSAEFPVKPANFFLQIYLAARIPHRTLPPPVPLLVLSSRKDRVVHPDCSKKIVAHWGGINSVKLAIHDDAGHDLSLDDPHWMLDEICNFFADQGLS